MSDNERIIRPPHGAAGIRKTAACAGPLAPGQAAPLRPHA